MVGVSTEQNTTNLIPALQAGIGRFMLVETSLATQLGWSEGLQDVLQRHKRQLLPPLALSKQEDSRIDLIAEKLTERLQDEPLVVWNLGGGQKAQQLALWQVFTQRIRQGYRDKACYTNPQSQQLEWWTIDAQGQLGFERQPIGVTLKAHDLLALYGFTSQGGELIYDAEQPELPVPYAHCPDLLDVAEFREYFYRLPLMHPMGQDEHVSFTIKEFKERLEQQKASIQKKLYNRVSNTQQLPSSPTAQEIAHFERECTKSAAKYAIDQMLWALRETPDTQYISVGNSRLQAQLRKAGMPAERLPILPRTLEQLTGEEKSAFYFEKVLIGRIVALLQDSAHSVSQAFANLKVSRKGQDALAAEYDILLVTKKGTLIALDAKTFGFETKDADARLYNLEKVGGKFVRFGVIIPLYTADLNSPYIPRKLRDLPLWAQRRNMPCFSVQQQGQAFSVSYTHTAQQAEVLPLGELLRKLGLLEQTPQPAPAPVAAPQPEAPTASGLPAVEDFSAAEVQVLLEQVGAPHSPISFTHQGQVFRLPMTGAAKARKLGLLQPPCRVWVSLQCNKEGAPTQAAFSRI